MIWEGSEYRGRGRQTVWDGGCALTNNRFDRISPIDLWNLDKKLTQTSATTLAWQALTTGGFGGFDAWLCDPRSGTLRIDTPLVKAEIPIAAIGLNDLVFEAGGIGRRLRVFRLHVDNPHRRLRLSRRDRSSRLATTLFMCASRWRTVTWPGRARSTFSAKGSMDSRSPECACPSPGSASRMPRD